jgi:hypothetical protein
MRIADRAMIGAAGETLSRTYSEEGPRMTRIPRIQTRIKPPGTSMWHSLFAFHWQDGYGLFSVSPSHRRAVHQYILGQEEHHRTETFQEEFLRILNKYGAEYDERYLWE